MVGREEKWSGGKRVDHAEWANGTEAASAGVRAERSTAKGVMEHKKKRKKGTHTHKNEAKEDHLNTST